MVFKFALFLLFSFIFCTRTITANELAASANNLTQSTEVRDHSDGQDGSDMWSMVASIGTNNGPGRVQIDEEGTSQIENSDEDQEEEQVNEGRRNRGKFDWDINLDNSGYYKLGWRVGNQCSSNKITFALRLDTDQFKVGADVFALGFSERGEIRSSDFCLVWYDLGHRMHLQDARTDADNKLQLDEDGSGQKSVCKLVRVSSHWSGHAPSELQGFVSDDNEEPRQQQDGDEEMVRHKVRELEIVFKRPLEVCGEKRGGRKYYTIDDGTTHLIWFKLNGPVLALDGLDLSEVEAAAKGQTKGSAAVDHRHHHATNDGAVDHLSSSIGAQVGLKRVQLIATRAASLGPDNNAKQNGLITRSLDIRMSKYPVPAQETTYWCKLFKLPSRFETRRYHITSYEAIIEQANEHVVHHMELFNCANLSPKQAADLDRLYEEDAGWSGECSSPERPLATQPCRRVILAWAMGARPLVYPTQVGQSIGGPNYSPYVVLEIHYNNVNKQAGLLDSSGLRFHYSSKLRPFDAGVLEVGLEYTDKNSIPPKMVAPLVGHCVGECTRVAMGSSSGGYGSAGGGSLNTELSHRGHHHQRQQQQQQGIYIFAAQMHTHLTGVASWTEHVRGGVLLGELQRDDHYSPHFQEIRLLPKPVHVLPGDSLLHYCLYDTSQRPNVTLGGFATSDEMCVTYLHYYPRIDLEVCKSSVDTRALEEYFVRLAREEGQATGLGLAEMGRPGQRSAGDNYRSIEWSPKRSRELLEFYWRAPLSVQCNRSNGERWPGEWNGLEPSKIFWLPREHESPMQGFENNTQTSIGFSSGKVALSRHPAAVDFLGSGGAGGGWVGMERSEIAVEYRGFGGRNSCRHAQCERSGPTNSVGAM